MSIAVIIITIFMLIGGIIPPITTNILENKLNEIFNKPQKIETRIYSTPSFNLLGGKVNRLEITLEKFKIKDLYIDRLIIITAPLDIDSNKLIWENITKLNTPTETEVNIIISQNSINDFFNSFPVKQKLEKIIKSQNSILPLQDLFQDIELNDIKIFLLKDQIKILGSIKTMNGFFTIPFESSFCLRLSSKTNLDILNLEIIIMYNKISDDIVNEIISKINPIIDLKNLLNSQDLSFEFRSLKIENSRINLKGSIFIKQLPG